MLTAEARASLLLSIADDELILGHRDLAWTGVAPTLEEDLAFSSISQDEIGHALALYRLASRQLDATVQQLVFGRAPAQYRHGRLLERPPGDFAFTIARRFVYELYDHLRLELLARSNWQPLQVLAKRIAVEEPLHMAHAWLWMQRLSTREPGRARLIRALRELLPVSGGLVAHVDCTPALCSSGDLPTPWLDLPHSWREQLTMRLRELDLGDLTGLVPKHFSSDREGSPSNTFRKLHAELTAVHSLAPEGAW